MGKCVDSIHKKEKKVEAVEEEEAKGEAEKHAAQQMVQRTTLLKKAHSTYFWMITVSKHLTRHHHCYFVNRICKEVRESCPAPTSSANSRIYPTWVGARVDTRSKDKAEPEAKPMVTNRRIRVCNVVG